MSQNNIDHDSDLDEEFEDVPINKSNNTSQPTSQRKWTPSLSLPPQQPSPIPGSQEETQLRGRLSTGIERITYRQMKSEMGMDAPDTHISHRKYESFAELSAEVENLIDMLWASSSPSIQTEGLITLAGIVEMALPTHPFDGRTTLSLLHKFDQVFVALCTGLHPLTGEPLLEAGDSERPLVTQTQKVRIRSLAETTRLKVFSVVGEDAEDAEGDEDAEGWVLEATKVYDGVLMLLGDSGDM
ncbi:uncharacterized protein N7469_005175 [Penicillium citrinum]|uniref:Uncharacterized protein n=1 Tax=Penicillium citrinum TaxID=5077 RepID=A0A9W9TQK3_PENCI|nr:uncharacterized protein N7469_005175 [Penicillium citrinum]KAJ5233409.1 hypothetical protein N7469_005175 [Penicillium citrinum]